MDITRKVWADEPVDVSNGVFNCIWQGDANDMILRSLALTSIPVQAWNLTSPEIFRVREVAERFGRLLGKPPRLAGVEAETALLGNSAKLCSELGRPATSLETVMRWTAHWVKSGGRSLDRPTHFETRDGAY
jgi:uncharacterized protein YbjT (DUF2867 family)